MAGETIPQLAAEAEKDISRVTGLTEAIGDEVAAVKSALNLLKTSSNATFPGTIVFDVIRQLESSIESLEVKAKGYEQEILHILRGIENKELPPKPPLPTSIIFTQKE